MRHIFIFALAKEVGVMRWRSGMTSPASGFCHRRAASWRAFVSPPSARPKAVEAGPLAQRVSRREPCTSAAWGGASLSIHTT
jgi:hypothetical protein